MRFIRTHIFINNKAIESTWKIIFLGAIIKNLDGHILSQEMIIELKIVLRKPATQGNPLAIEEIHVPKG